MALFTNRTEAYTISMTYQQFIKYQTMDPLNHTVEDISGFNSTGNATQFISPRNEKLARIEVIMQCICFSFAVLNNACVLVALLVRQKKISRMQLFILHLSIADMIVAFFNTLPQIIWDITYRFLAGDSMCRFIKYAQMFSLYLSTYVLIMTAVDRYRAICHPFTNQTWTPFMVYSMILGAYMIAAVFSIPQVILFRYQEIAPGSGEYDCWVHFEKSWGLEAYVLSIFCALYLIPLIILIVSYSAICYTIWSKYRSSNDSNSTERTYGQEVTCSPARRVENIQMRPTHRKRSSNVLLRTHSVRGFSRARLKTIKLTFAVILAYIICWSPFFVCQIWWLYDETATSKSESMVLILLLANLNSCTNPWIYLAFNRKVCRNLMPCGKGKASKEKTTTQGTIMKLLKSTDTDSPNAKRSSNDL